MTELENQALDALARASMRMGSSGKRFRNDLLHQREHDEAANLDTQFKLTARQASYLWFLVDLYRRQIQDDKLRGYGAYRRLTGELPDIYLPGDHREPVVRAKGSKRKKAAVETPNLESEAPPADVQRVLWEEKP